MQYRVQIIITSAPGLETLRCVPGTNSRCSRREGGGYFMLCSRRILNTPDRICITIHCKQTNFQHQINFVPTFQSFTISSDYFGPIITRLYTHRLNRSTFRISTIEGNKLTLLYNCLSCYLNRMEFHELNFQSLIRQNRWA